MKIISQGIYKLMNKTGYPSYDGFEIIRDAGNNGAHGLTTPGEFVLNLREEATVVVEGCAYGSGEMKAFQEDGERQVVTCRGLSAIRANDKEVTYYRINGVKKGKLTISVTGREYIHGFVVVYDKGIYDHDRVEVIDFGATVFEEHDKNSRVNHHLNAQIINGWYDPSIEPGLSGVEIPSSFFAADQKGDQVLFYDGNNKTDNRIRSRNQELTRFDDKAPKDVHGIVYSGYFYSNTAASPAVYLAVSADEGDRITAYTTSNALDSTIHFVNMSDPFDEQIQEYTGSGKIVPMVFYARKNGMYKQYSTTEKLAVARYVIEHARWTMVKGRVTAPQEIPAGYELVFTNDLSGAEYRAKPDENGNYELSLPSGLDYSYTVSLAGANGYVTKGNNRLNLADRVAEADFDVRIRAVELVRVSGRIQGLDSAALEKLSFVTEALEDVIYVPQILIDRDSGSYSAAYEAGVSYEFSACGVDDHFLTIDGRAVTNNSTPGQNVKGKDRGALVVKYTKDQTEDLIFEEKPLHAVIIESNFSKQDLEHMKFEFTILNEKFEPLEEYKYVFDGPDGIRLRDGQYRIRAVSEYEQLLTPDLKMNGSDTFATVDFRDASAAAPVVPYRETLTVGRDGDYRSINEALEAIRHMDRTREDSTGGEAVSFKHVTISISPGNYEEMLLIDTPDVSFVNAAGEGASTALKNKGVDIDGSAVRITFYYGHGYTYYSMGRDCKYDERLLWVNSHNGYSTYVNPGSGVTDGSYWNATVVVAADNVEFKDIILENSFNQYMSEMATKDIIVPQRAAKEGSVSRSEMDKGCTLLQKKEYVERAAALALHGGLSGIYFKNCRIISRQDTLYGGAGTKAVFERCAVYGSTDYIFGAMTAVFKECELVSNTEPGNKSDVFYITAAQQQKGRGFLFLDCHITAPTAGVDTCFDGPVTPGYLGRPWLGRTSEAVFFGTRIDAVEMNEDLSGSQTDRTGSHASVKEEKEQRSMIAPEGWNSNLGGESAFVYEFGTVEAAKIDNSSRRAVWANPCAGEDDAYIAAVEDDGTLSRDKKVRLTRENAEAVFLE